MNDDDEIIEIPIAGRTIVRASAWADGSGISIVLDGGTIMQIAARESLRGKLYWEIEEKPEWSGYPDPADPSNYWIDDKTGERIPAKDKP